MAEPTADTVDSRVPDGRRLFLGDGGLETTMIFQRGFELPEFASFVLREGRLLAG